MLFGGWTSLLRVLVVGVPAYFALILLLRLSGKRTLSKFNAFDLIITVAFGSTLSSGLLSKDLSLAEIVAAFSLLVALQFMITWSSVRWRFVDRMVKAEPQLVFRSGAFVHGAMRRERVTEGEVLAAIRNSGVGAENEVSAVVLETDGTLSVVTADHATNTLRNVRDAGL